MENDIFLPGFSEETISIFEKRHYTELPVSSTMHFHEFIEILLITKGSFEVISEGTVYDFKPNTAMVFKPYELHCTNIPALTDCRYFVIWIYGKNEAFYKHLTRHENGKNNQLNLREKDAEKILKFCETAASKGFSGENEFDMLSGFFHLLSTLDSNSYSESKKFSLLFSQIVEYTDENFRTIKRIKDISDKFGISQHYLIRLFKENLRVLPKDYIETKRMSAAKNDMIRGMNITEACYNNGFCDYCYFIKRFKERFGITPKQWQKLQNINRV